MRPFILRGAAPFALLLFLTLAMVGVGIGVTLYTLSERLNADQNAEALTLVCTEAGRLAINWRDHDIAEVMEGRKHSHAVNGLREEFFYDVTAEARPNILPNGRVIPYAGCPDITDFNRGYRTHARMETILSRNGRYVVAELGQMLDVDEDGVRRERQQQLSIIYGIDEKLREAQGRIRAGAAISLAGLVAAALLALWITTRFRRGVARINTAFDAVERGDWTARSSTGDTITELRDLTIHANAALTRIEAQMHALRLAGARIAHDLLDPLGLVRMRLRRAVDANPELDGLEAQLDAVTGAARGLLDIVSQADPVVGPVDLSALLAEMAGEFAEPAAANAQSIRLETAPAIGVMATPEGLRAILANLIGNAVRHGGPGNIAIRLAVSGAGQEAFRLVISNPLAEPAKQSTGRYGLGLDTVRLLALRFGLSTGLRVQAEVAESWLSGPRIIQT